jgi:hypothetical protein
MAVLLQAGMHDGEVGEAQLDCGRGDPVQPLTLSIDQGERGCSVSDRKRQARQARARPEVGPTLARFGRADRCQAKGVNEVPLPKPGLFPRAEKPQLHRLAVCLFQGSCVTGVEGESLLRAVTGFRMFHVKR